MSNRRRLKISALSSLLGILLVAGAGGKGYAGLVWEFTEKQFTADPSEKVLIAHFPFRNSGSDPVEITAVHTHCGCTGAKPDVNPVPPGGKGEVTVTFKFGDRRGLYSTPIRVVTNDAEAKETTLNLIALITPGATLKPQLLFWKKGEARIPKTLSIQGDANERLAKVDVVPGEVPVTAQVNESQEGYTVEVRPGTTVAFRGEIQVTALFASGKSKTWRVQLRGE